MNEHAAPKVTVPNPVQFSQELDELMAVYRPLQRSLSKRMADDVEAAGGQMNNISAMSGILQMDDLVPNAVFSMQQVVESGEPTIDYLDHIRDKYKANTGRILDMARLELKDPEQLAMLKEVDSRLHQLYHQVESWRPKSVGPHTDRIASESRPGWVRE